MERDGAAGSSQPARQALAAELEAGACQALLVIASSSRDPDLAPFVAYQGVSVDLVPEPGTGTLLMLGLVLMAAIRADVRRRRAHSRWIS